MQHVKITTTIIGLLVSGIVMGCSSGQDAEPTSQKQDEAHDQHEHSHAESHDHDHSDFVAAVTEIKKLNDSIQKAFVEGDLKKADPPVHEIGHVLESIHSLVEQTSLSTTDQNSVEIAVDSLFEAFAEIDEKIHGGKGASYADVEAKIKPAIAVLTEKANLVKEKEE